MESLIEVNDIPNIEMEVEDLILKDQLYNLIIDFI